MYSVSNNYKFILLSSSSSSSPLCRVFILIPETNYVPREYSVAAILLLLFMVLILLLLLLLLFYYWLQVSASKGHLVANNNNNNNHHKHQGLDPLIRTVSRVTAARANASSVFQLFSFLMVCSGMISKEFGFVAFCGSVKASSSCISPVLSLEILSWVWCPQDG